MATHTTNVTIPAAAHTYPILIGAGLLSEAGERIREAMPKASRCLVVTDEHVAPFYLDAFLNNIKAAGFDVGGEILAAGEGSKTLAVLQGLYDQALTFGIKRNDVIIALGGGIMGDLTGFFAATWLRGVPFVQVPTTLLAQVDSSVGGKVAVNHHRLKNMVGAFYHPALVLIDTDTLNSLPERTFACGMAEVVKYAFLERSVPGWVHPAERPLVEILEDDNRDLSRVILRCCQLKAAVVEADPEERKGIREMLNLGHTFGHAYETLSDGDIPHGEAVAMGMVNAFRLAQRLGQIDEAACIRAEKLLEASRLPLKPTISFSADEILSVMLQDKKVNRAGQLRLVLPYDTLGRVRIQEDVSVDDVKAIL